MAASLVQMQALLERMGERCDPQIYYKRVRQPMAGWRGNSALPHVSGGKTCCKQACAAPHGMLDRQPDIAKSKKGRVCCIHVFSKAT